jgi:hypothetical protein
MTLSYFDLQHSRDLLIQYSAHEANPAFGRLAWNMAQKMQAEMDAIENEKGLTNVN